MILGRPARARSGVGRTQARLYPRSRPKRPLLSSTRDVTRPGRHCWSPRPLARASRPFVLGSRNRTSAQESHPSGQSCRSGGEPSLKSRLFNLSRLAVKIGEY